MGDAREHFVARQLQQHRVQVVNHVQAQHRPERYRDQPEDQDRFKGVEERIKHHHPHDGPRCADGWDHRSAVKGQAHVGERAAQRRGQVEQQELAPAVHVFQPAAEPVQQEHVEDDVPDPVAVMAERARQQPPDLALFDLPRVQFEPLLHDRDAAARHLAHRLFQFPAVLAEGCLLFLPFDPGGRALLAGGPRRLALGPFQLGLLPFDRRLESLGQFRGGSAGREDLQKEDDDVRHDQVLDDGGELNAPAGEPGRVTAVTEVIAVLVSHVAALVVRGKRQANYRPPVASVQGTAGPYSNAESGGEGG